MTQVHSFKSVEVKPAPSFDQHREHDWVTVVNPTNRRMLLQACDNCGVVKSENTVVQGCRKPHGQRLISRSLNQDLRLSA